MDIKTREQRSYNMSRVKSKNTKPERIMFELLRKYGYKFKKHYPVLGKPDIAFPKYKVVVFINGEFWHGKNYKSLKKTIPDFWVKKIGQNIKRDKFIQRKLRRGGWYIINFWSRSILRRPEQSLKRLLHFLGKMNIPAKRG